LEGKERASILPVAQIRQYFPELLQCRLKVFHDLLGDDVRIGKVVRGFKGG
jgi:hypothetical protein